MKCLFFRANKSNDDMYYMIFVEDIVQVFRNNTCPDNLDVAEIKFDDGLTAEEALEMMRSKHGWAKE